MDLFITLHCLPGKLKTHIKTQYLSLPDLLDFLVSTQIVHSLLNGGGGDM